MLELKTEIIIDESAEKIWQVLADFKRYPLWNPFVKGILGGLAVGEKLTVQIGPPGKKEMTFLPTLITVKENHEIRWVGKFLLSPLFRGEHYFILEPIIASTKRLTDIITVTVSFETGQIASTPDKGSRKIEDAH